MEEQKTTVEVEVAVPLGHQLARLALATMASFVAGKVVEGAYNKFILERRTTETVEVS